MTDLKKVQNLAQILQLAASTWPDKIAMKYRPRFRAVGFTYSQIYQLAQTTAYNLTRSGVKKGDRVLIWALNSPYWVAGFFGIQLLGAIAVPLNHQSSEKLIQKIARETDAKFLLKSQILTKPQSLKIQFLDLENLQSSTTVSLPKITVKKTDLAEIVYTSGTTGDPKGVMLTHKNILANLQSVLAIINLTPKDRGLSILPLSHMFAQITDMFAPTACGATITFATALNSINIGKNMVEDKITKMAAVPEFLRLVVRNIEAKAVQEGKRPLFNLLLLLAAAIPVMAARRLIFAPILTKFGGKLTTFFSGGAALDPAIGQKWEALGITILQGYGTTETSPVITTNTYRDHQVASVGKPLPGVQVKIAPDGEILVFGPNVFVGYYHDPVKTRQSFTRGWYKTGDLGFFDKKGHLHITGRKKYLIVTEAGVNVYPEDIEQKLNKIPQVHDSCVVGLKNDGQVIIHAVLLGEKLGSPQKIIEKINQSLESFQQIQDFSIWPFVDFPRTVTQKIKRDEVIKYLQTAQIAQDQLPAAKAGVVERILAKITNLPVSQITPVKKLVADLKMDSLERVELVAAIEEETGLVLDETEIGPATTVAAIQKMVESRLQKTEKHPFKTWPLTWSAVLARQLVQKLLLKTPVAYFVKVQVAGIENLRHLKTPVLFYANHISSVDAAVILAKLPKPLAAKTVTAAASDVIFENPKYASYEGLLTFLLNIFPFARTGQIKSSFDYTGRLLDRGFSILFFPEGRVSENARLQNLKEGAGFLACEMQVPVVPIIVKSLEKIVPPGAEFPCWPNRGEAEIHFGKPLQFPPQSSYLAATAKIEKALRSLAYSR